ncbi:hypothetical protein KR222_008234, partial [Zaprionus bogoriensis]
HFHRQIDCRFEFTNLQCKSFDKTLVEFDTCQLRSVNRTYKYASVKIALNETLQDVSVRMVFLKRLNGFKPFLYDLTIDCCKFLKQQKQAKVANFFYGLFAPYSNVNHSCPFMNDITIEKVPISHLDHQLSDILPLPEGVYRIETTWLINSIVRVEILIDFRKE